VSGTLGGAGLHLCYHQQASEQLQLGVELDTNFRMQESVASIGYQVDLPKADLCFRGKWTHLNVITFWVKVRDINFICNFKPKSIDVLHCWRVA
jgi:hypothetical protein